MAFSGERNKQQAGGEKEERQLFRVNDGVTATPLLLFAAWFSGREKGHRRQVYPVKGQAAAAFSTDFVNQILISLSQICFPVVSTGGGFRSVVGWLWSFGNGDVVWVLCVCALYNGSEECVYMLVFFRSDF